MKRSLANHAIIPEAFLNRDVFYRGGSGPSSPVSIILMSKLLLWSVSVSDEYVKEITIKSQHVAPVIEI
jgi:hypothetical protein